MARIEELLNFRKSLIQRLAPAKVRGVAVRLADSLLGYPIITPTQVASLHSVTYPPANAAIGKLVELGIPREITGRSYGRIFISDEVMSILRRKMICA